MAAPIMSMEENKYKVTDAELPSFVSKVRKKIGVLGKGTTSDHFVKAFLLRHTNPTNLKNRDDRVDPFKAFLLDALPVKRNRRQPKKERKTLTCKEKKRLKIFQIPSELQKYEMYLSMNQLWKDYIADVVNFSKFDPKNHSINAVFLKVDYHGCLLTVKQSKNPSLVGMHGIMVQETKNTFKLITKDDKLKVIPKNGSIFSYELNGYEFNIHGSQFLHRAAERSTYKFGKKIITSLDP